MKNFYSILNFMLLILATTSAIARSSVEFRASEPGYHNKVTGQIDWPGGDISTFRGNVIVLISPGGTYDRDGWLLKALNTAWAKRYPYRDISDAFVKSGHAVVRFDSPGVLPPSFHCRTAIMAGKVRTSVIRKQCIDIKRLSSIAVPQYQKSIEAVLQTVQKLMPAASEHLVLFGISEGVWHIGDIVSRNHAGVRAILSLGGGAERMDTLTTWQLTARPINRIREFDANSDGVITNVEILDGYARGIGNEMLDVRDWMSLSGAWDAENFTLFEKRIWDSHRWIMQHSGGYVKPGKLRWVSYQEVAIPESTESFWNYIIRGTGSPLADFVAADLPVLFIWGAEDKQINVEHQRNMAMAVDSSHLVHSIVYEGRHHLLSRYADRDWFEEGFADQLAAQVSEFLAALPVRNQ